MPLPYEFKHRSELVRILKKEKSHISTQFAVRDEDLHALINQSIGGNTFRAFHNMPTPPSEFFRDWAFTEFSAEQTLSSLLSVAFQSEYDTWLKELAGSLCNAWTATMGEGKAIPYGPRMKLCNLLLKRVVLWNRIPEGKRKSLINFLHVPLDKFTLAAIRNCVEADAESEVIGKIPKNPTMSFVKNEQMYLEIQRTIRELSESAGVPPIFLDVVAWDTPHLTPKNAIKENGKSLSETRGSDNKRKKFKWTYDVEKRAVLIRNEDGKTHEYALKEIQRILLGASMVFGNDYFPLSNNVEKLADGTERRGLGTIILEQKPGDIYHAQGASYLGVVLEECGIFEWNGKRIGICWRLLRSDLNSSDISSLLRS